MTPLFVQDGGIAGSIISLFLVGSVAEHLWGSGRWLLIFFVSGILSEVVAFMWQPVGAENSVTNFGLAASISLLCLRPSVQWQGRTAAAVTFIAGALLLIFKDIHGAATFIGAILGLCLLRLKRPSTRAG